MLMRVLSLFDYTGYMLKPWRDAGHETIAVDLLHGAINAVPSGPHFDTAYNWDITDPDTYKRLLDLEPDILFGFPDCTHLAVSGAKHFAAKLKKDPDIQERAVRNARIVEDLGEELGIPWMLENPVGVMSSLWRPADYYFDPWMYAGYLPEDDVHPDWPKYIPPRDQYPKKTGIWTTDAFWMPGEAWEPMAWKRNRPIFFPEWRKSPEGKQYSKLFSGLGGKTLRTKIIRSATPRGFANAVYYANAPENRELEDE